MDKQDKELLLKDLCTRLPYGVKCDWNGKAYELVEIDIKKCLVYIFRYDWIEPTSLPYSISSGDEIKPYLRPMSSMTEEEIKEWDNICVMMRNMPVESIPMVFRFVNSKHLDYYNLIPKGLAIEAPDGMYNV